MKRLCFLAFVFCIGLSPARARAGCGASICPLSSYHGASRGKLHLQLSHDYINQNRINVGSHRDTVGALPNPHDEVKTINQRTLLQAQYGLSNAFGINVELPFIIREHSHLEDGTLLESFKFDGFGDLSLSGQYGLSFGAPEKLAHLDFLVGVKIPTGVTDAANADGEEAEVTIQPGTGSWDGSLGLNLALPLVKIKSLSGALFSHLPLNVGVSYRVGGKGTKDYRFGSQVMAHVGTEYQIFPKFSLLFQANGRWQDFADVGTTGEFRSNTGGTYIFASPGLGFHFSELWSAYGYAQLPVYQKVNGIQQVAKLNLQFGLSANVNLLK